MIAPDAGDGATADGPGVVNPGPPDTGTPPEPALNPVWGENRLPGTGEWSLTSPAINREIEGYASRTSVAPGETIRLYVNTASARYGIEVFRLGWYAGKGGRNLLPDTERTGRVQTTPTPDADGLVECDWADPYELTIPASWVTGIYLAKLTTKDTGKQSYIPFVVRDDQRVATYLVQSSVTTFQAYNNWGGRSLYDFNSDGELRASRVSFLRPYAFGLNPESAAGVGAGEILTNIQGAAQTGPMGWEYPMVRFLEREGYDVSYVTNLDVHRDATLVGRHRVFVSVGHDEYWSAQMRDHVEYARDHDATSLAFLSGNVSYWQVRFQPSKSGAPDTTLYCTKDAATDPMSISADLDQTTVLFRDPLLARGEEGLGGVAFQDYGINADLVVEEPTSWLFGGTQLAAGAKLPGLLGYEVEGVPEPPLPGVRRVMRSPWTTTRPTNGTSEATLRALPSGAETFAAGSIQLAWGLDDHRLLGVTQPVVANPAAQQMVRNILARFAAPRPNAIHSPLLLAEPFAAIAPEKWQRRTINEGAAAFDPAVAVTATNGQLTIVPRANVTGLRHGGVASAHTFPMTCGSAKVTVAQATNATSDADTTFALVVDDGHYYRMTVEAGLLYFTARDGGGSSISIAYDGAAHKHFRIRHHCPTDTVVFETSPDATTWTARRTIARAIDLRAAYIELEAGTFQAEASPGQAVFDDLQIESTGVREGFDRQRDPEVFTPASLHEGGADPLVRVFPSQSRLHLRPRAGIAGSHHLGYATTRAFDWTGGVAGITILQQPNPASEASVSLAVIAQDPGWARATVSAGKLFLQATGATAGSVTFDPVAHKHIRLRHDEVDATIVWETSPDGVTWTERRRHTPSFVVTGMRAEIEAGTYQSEANPGEILVDDFVFAR